MSDRLRNHVVLAAEPPTDYPDSNNPGATRSPIDGDLWVDSNYFVINVFDSNEIAGPTAGWVGVTDKTQTGSIVFFRDTMPDLTDIYPALNNLPKDSPLDSLDISPLPGTLWYDTANMLLKIFMPNAGTPSNDLSADSWVAVTSAHYMTQAIQRGLEAMDTKVTALEEQVQNIIDNTP